MKYMSIICHILDVRKEQEWLTNEVGVTIFKIIKEDEYDETNIRRIIFCVPDEEFETMLKLKYPPGIFEEFIE